MFRTPSNAPNLTELGQALTDASTVAVVTRKGSHSGFAGGENELLRAKTNLGWSWLNYRPDSLRFARRVGPPPEIFT